LKQRRLNKLRAAAYSDNADVKTRRMLAASVAG